MTWVKVCGLTHPDDVAVAVAAGADAVGFVTAAGSPRRVPLRDVRALADGIPVVTVLVTVDMPAAELVAAAFGAEVGAVQPAGAHAAQAAADARAAGLWVLRPVHVAGAVDLTGVPADQMPLLDTRVGDAAGGTGVTWDWSLATGVERRYVLAGGLGPDNVAAAVAAARPWGVDASSGLEAAPGRKDPDKVRRFVEGASSTW